MHASDIRTKLADALALDLIGPEPGSEHESETLDQAPSRWYLTGFLVPFGAAISQKTDESSAEEIDGANGTGGGDDDSAPEPVAARRAIFPSSMGLSVLVPRSTTKVEVLIHWGDYTPTISPEQEAADVPIPSTWTRRQRTERVVVDLPADSVKPVERPVPDSNGLALAVSVRAIPNAAVFDGTIPEGARSASFFLVNRRSPTKDNLKDAAFTFQTQLCVESAECFIPRANIRGLKSDDWDERVADLQYHDACEFAVGHGVSAAAENDCLDCRRVSTAWIPQAAVERVAPAEIPDVVLRMEDLATLADGADAAAKLGPLVAHYRTWIAEQKAKAPTSPPRRAEVAMQLVKEATVAAKRIENGVALLAKDDVRTAFRIANRVMAEAARQRSNPKNPKGVKAPEWRPFQLAFLLMNLPGIADPTDDDREVVDLLFFPTGGGKTEAYLGLAAFTLVLRRLRNPGMTSAGVSVLMRYTLRLLTLDQLSRAATLICALEVERRKDPALLGEWPFEIGLWVGRGATPNLMGRKNDGDGESARARTMAFKNDPKHRPSPIPIENCPWCGTKFIAESFTLLPNNDHPIDLRVACTDRECAFRGSHPLPILAVDEPIYRRLPCFLISTVDKFAAMPWTGEVGGFFGRVDRHDKAGFYGPCSPGVGSPLPGQLPPPDLVIQDELHLISGPMGTMVGLYETALDELCSRTVDGRRIRPKIVASTATVRRAEHQIRALFRRHTVDVFPPPGPDRRTSFFAEVHRPEKSQPRLYLGVAAQGRSLKVVLLRTYLALMSAAEKCYVEAGGDRNPENPADPYMTLVGYFNSLRELGGSRRIVEDEVKTRLAGYGRRRRAGETTSPFAERKIDDDVLELTSRVSTDKVAEAKRRLSLPFRDEQSVDVAIATNMISVGLDITRLGLMAVLGQPKTHAEYIQATSRVGREPLKPGLVVTLLNVHRPRDRSHYERFRHYHETFYRSVEATSVTPFSPRALDRGLAGTLVAMARQGFAAMTPPHGAANITKDRAALDAVADAIASRARDVWAGDREEGEALAQRVRTRAADLLDEWSRIAAELNQTGGKLQYQKEVGGAGRLLYEFLNPDLKTLHPRHRKFRANRSMRDVEPAVDVWIKTLDDVEIEADA